MIPMKGMEPRQAIKIAAGSTIEQLSLASSSFLSKMADSPAERNCDD
jgi:hypothetical protein